MKQPAKRLRSRPTVGHVFRTVALLSTALLCGCEALQQTEPLRNVIERVDSHITEQHREQAREQALAQAQLQSQLTDMNGRLDTYNSQLEEANRQLQALNNKPLVALSAPPPPQKVRPVRKPDGPQKSLLEIKGKSLIGKSEWLWIQTLMANVAARIDTGTELSSIYATDLNLYEKDGESWARFSLAQGANNRDKKMAIDVPVARMTRLRSTDTEEAGARPVIRLPVRLGNIQQVTEFALSELANTRYSVSLGRNFLKDLAVVDVSEQYLQPKFEPVVAPPPQNNSEDATEAAAE